MTERAIIAENNSRHKRIDVPYDPITGVGSIGDRFEFRLSDAPYPVMYLPEPMRGEYVVDRLISLGSVAAFYRETGANLSMDEYVKFWSEFNELRCKYDFEFFACLYQTIEDGDTAEDIPFKMKRAQRKFIGMLEEMRLANIPIVSIVLKAKQMGLSTASQLYMHWIQTMLRKRWHSVICAHVKDSSLNIRAMYDKVITNMPPIGGEKFDVVPFKNTQNIKYIPQRDCRITVGTAQEPDSVRGQNPKLVHFSEVAYYPNTTMKGTAQLIGGIVSSMKLVPLSVQIYESTANGVGDFFHSLWLKAKKGEVVHRPIFLPWYNDERYALPFRDNKFHNHSGRLIDGCVEDFIRSMNEYEQGLFHNHPDCTLENIHWYRLKKAGMASEELMFQENPSDDVEAFQNSGLPAFRPNDIEAFRGDCKAPVAMGKLRGYTAVETAKINVKGRKGILQNLVFEEDHVVFNGTDPTGRARSAFNKLKIWEFPDDSVKMRDRYVVVFDPQRGLSDKADFGVIAVFDRYWMQYGGKPEIVAEWRGKIDKDITIWIAAQISEYYCKALLVPESNTYDADVKEDDAEFIFDTIAEYYSNLYSRTPADKIVEGAPVKYGFRTDRNTKPMIKENFVAILRERGYIERNGEALDEARIYEQKPNGKLGAKEGGHDDILMTRMIGCYICYDLPRPFVVSEGKSYSKKIIGESSI